MKLTNIIIVFLLVSLGCVGSAHTEACPKEEPARASERVQLPIRSRPQLDSVDCTFGPTSPPVTHQEAYERLKVAVARTTQWLQPSRSAISQGLSQAKPLTSEHAMYLASNHEMGEFLNGLHMAEENLFVATEMLSVDHVDSYSAIVCGLVLKNLDVAKRILQEAAQRHLKIPRDGGYDHLLEFDAMAEIAPKIVNIIDAAVIDISGRTSNEWIRHSFNETPYGKQAKQSLAVLEKAIAGLNSQWIDDKAPVGQLIARDEAVLWARAARTRIERMARFEQVTHYAVHAGWGPIADRDRVITAGKLFPGYFLLNECQSELFKLERKAHPTIRVMIHDVRLTCRQFMKSIRAEAKRWDILGLGVPSTLLWD